MPSVSWIEERIHFRVKDNNANRPKVLSIDVYREYGVKVPYMKIWRAKGKAMCKIKGTFEDSYRLVPSLCSTILKYNPGSVVRYQINVDGSFKRRFIALSGALQGFLNGCHPFIGVDGTFLKGQHHGMLLTAITLDGNKQLYPLAVAVVEIECFDSWVFFLESLRDGLRGDNFTFMSDRKKKGLWDVFTLVFPNSQQRFCMLHFFRKCSC